MAFYHDFTALKAERDRLARLTWDLACQAERLGIDCGKLKDLRQYRLDTLDRALGSRWDRGWLETSDADDRLAEAATAGLEFVHEELDLAIKRHRQHTSECKQFDELQNRLRDLPRRLRVADGVTTTAPLRRAIAFANELETKLDCWRAWLQKEQAAVTTADLCTAAWCMKYVRAFNASARALLRLVSESRLQEVTDAC
jgi:hypothetical protein